MSEEATIPPAARLLRDFVNTFEPQVDEEFLATPDHLANWLADRGIASRDARWEPDDLARARAIREGLRAVLLTHAGHPPTPGAVETLNRALAEAPVRLTFTEQGHHHLAPTGPGAMDRAVAALVDAIRRCDADQSWRRLKVCDRDSCRWAYYDASRNQARRWCSMAGCGNHVKMRRAYAARTVRRRPPGG